MFFILSFFPLEKAISGLEWGKVWTWHVYIIDSPPSPWQKPRWYMFYKPTSLFTGKNLENYRYTKLHPLFKFTVHPIKVWNAQHITNCSEGRTCFGRRGLGATKFTSVKVEWTQERGRGIERPPPNGHRRGRCPMSSLAERGGDLIMRVEDIGRGG